ncbi:hypothetical protein BH11BAC7_BH11BAC7_20000 [soil metagenome]
MKLFKDPIYLILLFYALVAALTIHFFNGTGDAGDSVTHYLFAKYAPQHPELFFHHWAKPVFVLLASPFAQFGFDGMKMFNALTTLGTIFLTYRIAERLKLHQSYAVMILLIFSPMYFVLTFSGLTEPLFALFVAGGIYLVTKRSYASAMLLISFLPFVRSEGLIIAGVFGIYLMIKQKWKLLPLLAVGHLVYSFAGYFVHHDLLWVFRKIPYARLDSIYGRGELTHFAKQLFYILGLPGFILFLLGVISILKDVIKRKESRVIPVLILGGFLAFFIAHTLFWYYGIFGSMGLTRVFICVIPLMALIMLKGFNLLTTELIPAKNNLAKIFSIAILAYVIVFPFTKTHGGIVFERDMKLSPDQKAVIEMAKFVRREFPLMPRVAYEAPYIGIALGIDPFDNAQRLDLNPENLKVLHPGELLIWDSHFALLDLKLRKEDLAKDASLKNINNSRVSEFSNTAEVSVYSKK